MQDLKKKIEKEPLEEQARLSAESLPVFLDSIWLVRNRLWERAFFEVSLELKRLFIWLVTVPGNGHDFAHALK
jgi:hypothetical protein